MDAPFTCMGSDSTKQQLHQDSSNSSTGHQDVTSSPENRHWFLASLNQVRPEHKSLFSLMLPLRSSTQCPFCGPLAVEAYFQVRMAKAHREGSNCAGLFTSVPALTNRMGAKLTGIILCCPHGVTSHVPDELTSYSVCSHV